MGQWYGSSIRFSTDGQQYGVADLDAFVLTAGSPIVGVTPVIPVTQDVFHINGLIVFDNYVQPELSVLSQVDPPADELFGPLASFPTTRNPLIIAGIT